jgi:hypothetical protein
VEAFDVVIRCRATASRASLPAPGGDPSESRAWNTLTKRLGYRKYVAQGGDWGAIIVDQMGAWEQPEFLSEAIRTGFKSLRSPDRRAP